jgi:hypothetical protein
MGLAGQVRDATGARKDARQRMQAAAGHPQGE